MTQVLAALDELGPIEVPAEIPKLYTITAMARKALTQPDILGRVDRWGVYVPGPPRLPNPLAIDVSDAQADRAVRLFDVMIRTLDQLGFKTKVPDSPGIECAMTGYSANDALPNLGRPSGKGWDGSTAATAHAQDRRSGRFGW